MFEIVHRPANNIRFYLKTMNRMYLLDAHVIFVSILNRKINWRISDHFNRVRLRIMVFNATFNNIPAILLGSVF